MTTEVCVMPPEWVKQTHSSCLQLSISACTRVTLSFYKIVRLLASGLNMKIQLFEYRGRKAAFFNNIIKQSRVWQCLRNISENYKFLQFFVSHSFTVEQCLWGLYITSVHAMKAKSNDRVTWQ